MVLENANLKVFDLIFKKIKALDLIIWLSHFIDFLFLEAFTFTFCHAPHLNISVLNHTNYKVCIFFFITCSRTTATASFPRIWTPLHNSWVHDSQISCYDQFRQFFAKIPAISRQNSSFASIWGKNFIEMNSLW